MGPKQQYKEDISDNIQSYGKEFGLKLTDCIRDEEVKKKI